MKQYEHDGEFEVLNHLKNVDDKPKQPEDKPKGIKGKDGIITDPSWLNMDNDALFSGFGSIRL